MRPAIASSTPRSAPTAVWRRAGHQRPPYAKRLRHTLDRPETWTAHPGTSADGRHLTLWVLAGFGAWDTAREWAETATLFVLAPWELDPATLDWRDLAGHPPILLHPCGDLPHQNLAALVAALIRDGCERVLVLFTQGPRLFRAGGRRA
jgi:hypothetical protein